MKFWKAMHPPLPQQFSASKRTVGPELEVGIRVRDIKYLLPQENGKLALTCTPKSITPSSVLGWFFLETNHERSQLTIAMSLVAPKFWEKPHCDHLTLAQVISEVLLGDLYQGERTSSNPLPAHHRRLQSQSLETFTFTLSIKFLWNMYSVSSMKLGIMGNGAFPKNVS